VAIQFRTNQYADESVTQAKHGKFLDHVTRVAYGNMVSDADQGGTDPTGMSVGDQYVVNNWSSQTDNHVVEWDGNTWVDHANSLNTGDRLRVTSSGAAGSFSGKDNYIMEKTATGYDELSPSTNHDGLQVAIVGPAASHWYADVFAWSDKASAWIAIGETLAIASGDNALEISGGELSHIDQMGHSVEPVDYYVYSDKDQQGSDPVAGNYSGHAIIMNNTTSYADGDVYYSNGNLWIQLTTSPLTTGDRVGTEPSVEASCGLEAGSFQVKGSSGTFGSTSDWDITNANPGDIIFVKDPAQNDGTTAFEKTTAMWDGSAWNPIAKWEATGDGIDTDTQANYTVKRQNGGGLNFDGSGNLIIDAQNSAGYPNEPTASDPLVTLSKVQSLLSGWNWQEPVKVLNIVSDADQGGSQPGFVSAGNAYVVNNWGVGYNDGDIVEADASLAWQVIVPNSGGEPPDGTRIIVGSNGAGSFSGHVGDIGTYDTGTSSWDFYDPNDGDGVLVAGDGGYYENQQYIYDTNTSPFPWVQVGAQVVYTGGNGIDITGSTISADVAAAGAIISSGGNGDELAVQVETSNPSLQISNNELGVKLGDGIGKDSTGLIVDYVNYEDVASAAEQAANHWDVSGTVGTLVEESAMVFLNGQKLKRTASNPPTEDGEWYWDSSNKYVVFKSGYLLENDEMTIWGLET